MKNFKKIALIWPSITTLGESDKYYNVQAYGLARELANKGLDVCIFTSQSMLNRDKNIKHAIHKNRENYRIVYLPTLVNTLRYPILKKLLQELRRFSPCIVQSAEDISPCTWTGFIYSKLYKKPFFVYQGIYRHPMKFSWLSQIIRPIFLRILYKKTTMFLTKSTAAKNFLMQCGVEKDKIKVVHVGFNSKNFQFVESDLLYNLSGFSKERLILLSVGKLIPHKNHKSMILAVDKLKERYPKISLVIIGDGPLLSSYQCLISKLNLNHYVRIVTKKIPQQEMAKIYSSAYIYLCPSLKEIFGITVLEAMACGVPVIGSNIGGMKDVIQSGKNGFLIEPEDIDALCGCISKLLEDQHMHAEFSKCAVETSKKFDWSIIVSKFLYCYEKGLTKLNC